MSTCIPPWFPTWWQWTTALNYKKAPKFQKTCWVPDCLPRGHWRTIDPTYYPISCPPFPLKIDPTSPKGTQCSGFYILVHNYISFPDAMRALGTTGILTSNSVYPPALGYTPFPGHNIQQNNCARTSLLSQRQCKFLGYQRWCWSPKFQMSLRSQNLSKDALPDVTSGW